MFQQIWHKPLHPLFFLLTIKIMFYLLLLSRIFKQQNEHDPSAPVNREEHKQLAFPLEADTSFNKVYNI